MPFEESTLHERLAVCYAVLRQNDVGGDQLLKNPRTLGQGLPAGKEAGGIFKC